jgi:PBP1b-binding outer membrane lipoprotein LpoB
MKIKIIVLLLVLGAVLLSGCLGDEKPSPENNATPAETVTPKENVTPSTNVTQEENVTPVESVTPEENITAVETVTPVGNVTPAAGQITTPDIRTTPYMIRLENYRATPASLEIKKGESVAWMNEQDNPKRKFTLVSEEGLFNDTTLVYKRAFTYTFNETGDYKFSIVGQPRMSVSVSVK